MARITQTFSLDEIELPCLTKSTGNSGGGKSKENTKYIKTNNRDDYFQDLLNIYENCSIHQNIINNKVDRMYGTGIEGYEKMFKKNIFDFEIANAFAIKVFWNLDHTQIIKVEGEDVTKFRFPSLQGVNNSDQLDIILYKDDWKDKNESTKVYQLFDPSQETDDVQIVYFNVKTSLHDYYAIAPYSAAIKAMYTNMIIQDFWLNLSNNNFTSSVIINHNSGGLMEPHEQAQFVKDVKKNFFNTKTAGAGMVSFNNNKDEAMTVETLDSGENDKKYIDMFGISQENIISNAGIVNPMLVGVKSLDDGGLGSSGEELKVSEMIYTANKIEPRRNVILEVYDILNEYMVTPIDTNVNNKLLFN
jgi:hypothetical protein